MHDVTNVAVNGLGGVTVWITNSSIQCVCEPWLGDKRGEALHSGTISSDAIANDPSRLMPALLVEDGEQQLRV